MPRLEADPEAEGSRLRDDNFWANCWSRGPPE